MFSFLRQRVLKEHMKLVAQSYKALTYLSAFMPPAIDQQYSEYLRDVNAIWRPGEKLDDDTFRLLLKINMDLRRVYDASPAKAFGMKPFDQEFKPLLGWEEYYSHYL